MPVLLGAEPFSADGSGDLARVGALLSHGFTGSPQSMRPWAEALAAAGVTVRLPRLPGHGTTWQELARTGWPDWYDTLDRAYDELAHRCDAVLVMGLSMGGTMALRLAEQHPAGSAHPAAGAVLVNASLMTTNRLVPLTPWLKHVVRTTKAIGGDIKKPGAQEVAYAKVPTAAVASLAQLWGVVRGDLGRITCPVLSLRSTVDHVVEPAENAAVLRDGLAPGLLTEVALPDSYHVATLDNDAPLIVERSLGLAREVAAGAGR